MTDSDIINKLYAALKHAEEHLDFTGYGDKYEREVARDKKLEQEIRAALIAAEDHR